MTNWRKLCTELLDLTEKLYKQAVTQPHNQVLELSNGRHVIPLGMDILAQDGIATHTIRRARAALAAEPPAPAVPDEVRVAFTELERRQESLNRFRDLRKELAAEPPAPDPREALAARPLLEAVARLGDRIGQHTVGEITTISDRAAAWLTENPPGQPVAIEPRGCPTPGACSCVEPPAPTPVADHIPDARNMALATDYAARLRRCPTHGQLPANAWGCPECLRELREELARLRAPAADGEREELASALEVTGSYEIPSYEQLRRAAALLRQLPPEGLVAVEYFHIASSARIVGEASEKWGECWNVYNSRHINPCTEFRTVADAVAALQQARHKEVGDE